MPKKPNPYDISAIFEEMTLDLIGSMRRNLMRHKLEESKEGFRWEMWQRAKLRNIASYRRTNSKIIQKAFKDSEKLVDDVLKDSFKTGENRIHRAWNRFLNVILKPFGIERNVSNIKVPIPKSSIPVIDIAWDKLARPTQESSFFGLNERKLEALQETVKNDLNSARGGVLRKMDDVYRQTIYKAEVNMSSGAKTLNQAIDMATKEFLQKGINTIEYANGRRVNIASYAEMALRTASQRATFLGEGKKRDELGVYTVLMSSHDNCSPMCLPYQGTVMIDDVYTSLSKEDALQMARETRYELLSEAMKNHAFHPNCRHSLSTFFPGINSIPEPADDEKAVANYEAEQRQRYYERGIRMYKRLYEGSVDEVNQARYKKKVNEWTERLKEHISEHDHLRRDRTREVG